MQTSSSSSSNQSGVVNKASDDGDNNKRLCSSLLVQQVMVNSSSSSNNKTSADLDLELEYGAKKQLPRPLVVCGPSGSGKSTLLKRLLAEFGDYFGFSVSHTTRAPRAGEQQGREYHFCSHQEFENKVSEGNFFLEHACFSDNMYGTSRQAVRQVLQRGRICVLDVEVEGVKALKQVADLWPRFVFVQPPSFEELERRLRMRGTDEEEAVARRLARAKLELEFASDPQQHFDLVLVNDHLDTAYAALRDFVLQDVEALKLSRGM